MALSVISFDEALQKTEGRKRHLLLGNGFSIALFPNKFRYGSLLDRAKEDGVFNEYPELVEAFEILSTTDFEVVLEALVRMTRLIHLYVDDINPRSKLVQHVERLKEALITAVAGSHPARLSEIQSQQFDMCRKFLLNFAGAGLEKPGCIYTLNYDLLLYWAVLHEPQPEWKGLSLVQPPKELLLKHDDGFRSPDDYPDAPYVTWDVDGGSNKQNIHFIHGGLHIFDGGFELQKYCWERSGGVPLMDQIKDALDADIYPVFVSEGNCESKLQKILHNGYLTRSFKSLAGVCNSPTSSLFIYGHSLASNDDHILRLIEDGQIREVYISIYGNIDDEFNKYMVERATLLNARRDRFPLNVYLYDAQSAKVWG
ncbi:hypothetical protein BV98_002000 [Sphingobium herbicidovorans NBRC 16415]|uniref:DUF4917 domain-containing protein n=1 Tax=Sphingobium herbicidovorans (strain ATCC 700291 / DSM 11019 / CCUG 56400 / KCTC 2939 / LMG 18315 / NBRC 16415 / MH) TaxID=1219045 RepID=A0A086P9X9_SPHHM|nr:DUF4917 family protein [Sphingobium herbicidovorans]KFG90197.1 hypothetical protein BV98_002000 [Sphingobium herbicidovorans NBRC 16415]